MRRLVLGFAGRKYHIVGNLMHWLKCYLVYNLAAKVNITYILIYTGSKVKHRLNILQEKTVKLSKYELIHVIFMKIR